jgi:hypothetical protein
VLLLLLLLLLSLLLVWLGGNWERLLLRPLCVHDAAAAGAWCMVHGLHKHC